ncbi:nicotinate-nucleotide--dimethylbenzimidazole phosphoribosyltransferase [Acetobacter pomorum]|uniref:Nicotinate-nucleotide--dimethylbenzimidazole phosphoribosyltransferase n=1 Tax=Acetobacter pomorum TaxID=65959 RepID=A0A2G4R7S9_9PROT|nr:nicotinate-nucleotide--dimethylbenzimidazole phosphoribosyltransferase [Acetobacter pomorum]PHY92609.1 nicotinate-nucleotide--dimethylbenzimidazole phosphoribosyltransferase [Acetobacter pomorum]
MPSSLPFSNAAHHLGSMQELRSLCHTLPQADQAAQSAIAYREQQLTKPEGSLGRLEELTRWLGGWQRRTTPQLENVQILVFAGNHGVTQQGISPWPATVTAQMVSNFHHGGAAINQIAKTVGACLHVIPVHNLQPTADFTQSAAMTEQDFLHAVMLGYNAVSSDCDLLCLGEMGIGNTTAAATLAAALFKEKGVIWAGRGTGADDAGLKRKAAVIDKALSLHQHISSDPLEAARCIGGYELAATLGATLAARHKNVPVVLDGFVCTAAAAPLAQLHPAGLAHTCLSHCATTTGQTHRLASYLGLEPLLGLGLRLGEGSGAALAVSIIRAALACHTGMATFTEAAVSQKT